MRITIFLAALIIPSGVMAQINTEYNNTIPPAVDPHMYEIIEAVSADRLETYIQTLVDFGTRNTLSDTVSQKRGIGAARRWIKSEFENISKDCGGCLEISYQNSLVKKGENSRITKDVMVVNVLAIQRGTKYPSRYIIMSGDIDSRISDASDFTNESPGANDNASGMAGTIEAARVLSKYNFPTSIIYVGLSGEEQGLFGGKHMAAVAKAEGWDIVGVINNDMIGNIEGVDGVIDNTTFRVFSEPTPVRKLTGSGICVVILEEKLMVFQDNWHGILTVWQKYICPTWMQS